MTTPLIIRPQPGPQEQFLSTSADIALYGGAAFSGKSFANLLMPLHHIGEPEFGAVFFRRTSPEITNEGGLWDEANKIYSPIKGARSSSHPLLMWRFPSGSKVRFSHLQHENDIYSWQGAQIPLLLFDELTHFTETQFFYMVGRNRNRSNNGIRPYVRATCNPDPDSWVRNFIDWWIDEYGFPIKERSGKIRYFCRINNKIQWGDTPQELINQFGNDCDPKSFTFIAASIYDNAIGMSNDPAYISNLKALPEHEKKRLLNGNWNARPTGGEFNHKHIQYFNNMASNFTASEMNIYILYDPANQKRKYSDSTAIVVVGLAPDNNYYILDMVRDKLNPTERIDKLFAVHKKWNAKGSKPPIVVCEQYGMMTDAFYIQQKQQSLNYRFTVTQVGGQMKKEDRIRRLIPIWESNRIYLPQFMEYNTLSGERIDLTKYLIDKEMLIFPSENKHDDLLDALSRIMDDEVYANFPKLYRHHISDNVSIASTLEHPFDEQPDDFTAW